jgi:hypothetical protein
VVVKTKEDMSTKVKRPFLIIALVVLVLTGVCFVILNKLLNYSFKESLMLAVVVPILGIGLEVIAFQRKNRK